WTCNLPLMEIKKRSSSRQLRVFPLDYPISVSDLTPDESVACSTPNRSTIQKRLILSLYGLGTNTGLKRVAAGNYGESFKNLLYTRRKFIHKDNLKKATAEVVNAILSNRIQKIWGEGTTSCASDAKKFGAWDQNLMTE